MVIRKSSKRWYVMFMHYDSDDVDEISGYLEDFIPVSVVRKISNIIDFRREMIRYAPRLREDDISLGYVDEKDNVHWMGGIVLQRGVWWFYTPKGDPEVAVLPNGTLRPRQGSRQGRQLDLDSYAGPRNKKSSVKRK